MSGFSANAFLETAEAQGAEIQGGFGVYDDLRYQPAGDRSDAEAVTAEARGYDQPPVLVEPVDDRQHIGGGQSRWPAQTRTTVNLSRPSNPAYK